MATASDIIEMQHNWNSGLKPHIHRDKFEITELNSRGGWLGSLRVHAEADKQCKNERSAHLPDPKL